MRSAKTIVTNLRATALSVGAWGRDAPQLRPNLGVGAHVRPHDRQSESTRTPGAGSASGGERAGQRLCGIADKLDRATCCPGDADCVGTCRVRLDGWRETGGREESFLACTQEFEGARVAWVGLYPDVTSPPCS